MRQSQGCWIKADLIMSLSYLKPLSGSTCSQNKDISAPWLRQLWLPCKQGDGGVGWAFTLGLR